MGHCVSLGIVDTIVREISGGDRLINAWRGIQCTLPLLDDRILLGEPGAEVSLFVRVELVLGHLVPPLGPSWHGELNQLGPCRGGCDPFVPEHCEVAWDGSPEHDGRSQCSGISEKALVELDKLALEVACPRDLVCREPRVGCLSGVWTDFFLALVRRRRCISAFDCAFELELGFSLFS